MRKSIAIVASSAILTACQTVGANWTPIDRAGSQISIVGDDTAVVSREWKRGPNSRYQERLSLRKGGTIFLEELYTGYFGSGPVGKDYLLKNDAPRAKANYGVEITEADVKARAISNGDLFYAAKASNTHSCFIGEAETGNIRGLGRDGHLQIVACRPGDIVAALESEMLDLVGRLRFDGGQLNKDTASPTAANRSPSSVEPIEDADAETLYRKGNQYRNGSGGIKPDSSQAVRYFRAAAEKGNVNAQTALGNAYRTGDGVPVNLTEMRVWYERAAASGDAAAQNNLGTIAKQGLGMPRDLGKAVTHFRLAADRGNPIAMSNLGQSYRDGDGVPSDAGEAYFWYALAASKGYDEARSNRDMQGRKISTGQKQAFDAKVAAWKPVAGSPVSSGLRTFTANWEGSSTPLTGTMAFVGGNSGSIKLAEQPGLGECSGTYALATPDKGSWSLACGDATTATGTVTLLGNNRGAVGEGQDSRGRKITFDVSAIK